MRINKKIASLAGIVALGLALLTAAPANAAAPSKAEGVAVSPAAPESAVKPNYPAGKYFYVCYSTAGTSVTLKDGQSVASGCRGAAYVAQYLESGQLVQTQSLTPGGSPAHPKFTGTADCYVAIGVAAFAVLTAADSWVWYVGTAPTIYGLHACVSG